MKWEDMPKDKRPIAIKVTSFPTYYSESFPRKTVEELGLIDKTKKINPYFFKEDKASYDPEEKIVRLGPRVTPSTLGHEIGHAFDPNLGELDVAEHVPREEYAWKSYIKGCLRSGNLDRESIHDMIVSLVSYYQHELDHKDSSDLYRIAGIRISKLVREAKKELKEEGEL